MLMQYLYEFLPQKSDQDLADLYFRGIVSFFFGFNSLIVANNTNKINVSAKKADSKLETAEQHW